MATAYFTLQTKEHGEDTWQDVTTLEITGSGELWDIAAVEVPGSQTTRFRVVASVVNGGMEWYTAVMVYEVGA